MALRAQAWTPPGGSILRRSAGLLLMLAWAGCSAVTDFDAPRTPSSSQSQPDGAPPTWLDRDRLDPDIAPLPDGAVVLPDGTVVFPGAHRPDPDIPIVRPSTDAGAQSDATPPNGPPVPRPPMPRPVDAAVPPDSATQPPPPPRDASPIPDAASRCPAGCDDGLDCTVDVCQSDGRCVHMRDDSRCEGTLRGCFTARCLPTLARPASSGCFAVPACTDPSRPKCTPLAVCVECLTDSDCAPADCCSPARCMPNGSCQTRSLCEGGSGKARARCCATDDGCECADKCDKPNKGKGNKKDG